MLRQWKYKIKSRNEKYFKEKICKTRQKTKYKHKEGR